MHFSHSPAVPPISRSLSRSYVPQNPFFDFGPVPVFFDAPDETNANGHSSGNNNSQSNNKPDKKSVSDAVKEAIAELLGKKNDDPMAALETLVKRNHALEQRAEKAEKERDEFKGRVPSQSATKTLEAYQALGTPEELKAAQDERDTLKKQVEDAKAENAVILREQVLRDVHDKTGWNLAVLKKLDALTPGLEYSFKEVDENGKKVERVFVKFKDGEGDNAPVKESEAVAFAEANSEWKLFLPALLADTSDKDTDGTRVAKQSSGNGGGKPNAFDALRNRNKAASEVNKGQAPSIDQIMNIGSNASPMV